MRTSILIAGAIAAVAIGATGQWALTREQGSSPQAKPYDGPVLYPFSPTGCAFVAMFPKRPAERSMGAKGHEWLLAEVVAPGEHLLRAECHGIELRDPVADARTRIEAFATAEGFASTAYRELPREGGGLWEMRAHKTLDGVPVTYLYRTYYQDGSFMVVMLGGTSANFPTSAGMAFLGSVRPARPPS